MLSGIPHPDSGSICKRDRYYNDRPTQGRSYQNVGRRFSIGCFFAGRRPEYQAAG